MIIDSFIASINKRLEFHTIDQLRSGPVTELMRDDLEVYLKLTYNIPKVYRDKILSPARVEEIQRYRLPA